jgi:hypothetical protein
MNSATGLPLCAQTCETCAVECAKHEVAFTQRCAESCRQCAEQIAELTAAV